MEDNARSMLPRSQAEEKPMKTRKETSRCTLSGHAGEWSGGAVCSDHSSRFKQFQASSLQVKELDENDSTCNVHQL